MLLYLLQITTVFSVLYLLYILFLNGLTFHRTNRLVLILLPIISLIIPFLNEVFPTLSTRGIKIPLFDNVAMDTINQQLQMIEAPLAVTHFNYLTVLSTVYWLVSSIYCLRILIETRRLFLLKSTSVVEQKLGYQLITAKAPDIFSYFHWIFIPKHKTAQYQPEILAHEKIHIQLKHSWDVMLTEIFIAFFWWNPLVYFYRKSLKSVHEFQADQGVLQNGTKTSKYMQLLMQSLEIHKPNDMYNYFNQSILKKRVDMMTKPKSNPFFKLVYILLIPVCVFLVLAFTPPNIKNGAYLNILNTPTNLTKPPSLFPVQNGTQDHISSFFGVKRKHLKDKKIHGGIDIRGKIGTPILATADGIISKASLEGNWGNLIIITHDTGYETWYAHLKDFNINENQRVKKGAIIGYLGNTGKTTGPHLHYEIKQNGKRLNPIKYVE